MRLGEDVTEELAYILSRFVVKRINRSRLTYGGCKRLLQSPLPPRPIERGGPGPAQDLATGADPSCGGADEAPAAIH